jgi:serine/threonine protein phosphatase PrpC
MNLKRGLSRIRRGSLANNFKHHLSFQSDNLIACGSTSLTGRRTSNEDVFAACLRPGQRHKIIGVFDGHNGPRAAEYVAAHLQPMFSRWFEDDVSDVPSALRATFHSLETDLMEAEETSGTCAAVTVFDALTSSLCIANIGDSRVVLGDYNVSGGSDGSGGSGSGSGSSDTTPRAVVLSTDHRPSNNEERARIEAAGSQIRAVSYDIDDPGIVRIHPGGMAVSRALGGVQHKRNSGSISAIPQLETYDNLHPNDFLIMASDGVWDVISCEEAVDRVHKSLSALMPYHTSLYEQERVSPSPDHIVRSRDVGNYSVGQMVDLPTSQIHGFVVQIEGKVQDSIVQGAGYLHVRKIPPMQATGSGPLVAWSCASACQELVDECLRRGATDNLTMTILKLLP